jgi:hypothetical protein
VKWVFTVKRDEHRTLSKHKAHLVLKGYVYQHNIDYDEVFVSMARLDSVGLVITIVAYEGWEVHHMDVKTTFLNGDLQEEVYVDDLVITSSGDDNIKSFSKEMSTTFKMSNLDLLHYNLSIEMKQSTDGISLSQGAYARKHLERCGICQDAIPIIRPWRHS